MRLIFRALLLFVVSVNAHALTEGELQEGLVNPGYFGKPSWFKESFLDLREDVAEAKASGKQLLLLFHQDGCPYCEKLLKVNFTQAEIVTKAQADFDVIEINMWGDREVIGLSGEPMSEKLFAQQLQVQFTPTLIFLDQDAHITFRANGYYPPEKFLRLLNYLSSDINKAQVSFNQYSDKSQNTPIKQYHYSLPYPLNLRRSAGMKPLAVIFESSGCLACQEYHHYFEERTEFRDLLHRFDIAQIDIHTSTPVTTPKGINTTSADWARSLGVQYTPSIIFFDDRAQQVFATEAYLRPFHLHASLKYVESRSYTQQPQFQRYVQQLADQMREQGLEPDLWK